MRDRLWLAFLLMLSSFALGAEDLPYRFEGLAVSAYNDNSPYLYDSNGLLNVGVGRGADDQFTAGFRVDTLGALKSAWSDSLMVSANLALFTDTQYYALGQTGSEEHSPWRIDTGSLQFLWEKTWQPLTVDYGMGGLIRGNLGGGALQNSIHQGIEDVQFHLPYVGGYAVGPFLTATVKYGLLDETWAGWNGKLSTSTRGVWDVVGVLQDELDALVQLDLTTGAVRFQFVTGARLSLPGTHANQTRLYSSGMFFDHNLELSFGDFRVQFGYAINPYGAAPISAYPDYRDQNQEFHWTFIWGQDIPVPWALRFFP